MPIDVKRKLAFCHVPRTGGVSVCEALGMKVVSRHAPASWYRMHYPQFYLFSIHRDYADRIRSAFGWRVPDSRLHLVGPDKPLKNFDDLVADVMTRTSNHSLMLTPNEYFLDCNVDRLLRFSHLEDDLNTMLADLGHDTVRLPQMNSFRDDET